MTPAPVFEAVNGLNPLGTWKLPIHGNETQRLGQRALINGGAALLELPLQEDLRLRHRHYPPALVVAQPACQEVLLE